ncbi:MAG: hypothetical protein GX162_06505 [Firmicutes bacterium]|nr:hypothetical protein [Bacillota bacterium]
MRRSIRKSQRKNLSKPGDISLFAPFDNPDDTEFAAPLAPGDSDSLIATDNPDDIEDEVRRRRKKRSNRP